MTREEFLRTASIAGLGITALPSLLASCKKDDGIQVNFDGNVIIIGAGSAGMMAAHRLARYGVSFQVLEASDRFGGRVRRDTDLADYPIDTGAEWIHTDPAIFSRLIDDEDVKGEIELIPYNPQTIQSWSDGQLTNVNVVANVYREYKFKQTTWYGFFEDYVVPAISENITYNTPVVSIDYTGARVRVTTESGDIYDADKVIVTVPLKILQDEDISFVPAMPSDKMEAINSVDMPPGLKAAIRFSEKFYPDLLARDGITNQDVLYLDGAFRKEAEANICAFFSAGDVTAEYTDLGSDDAILERMIAELDEMLDGKASKYYEDSLVMNWAAHPYVRGSYSFHGSDDSVRAKMAEDLSNKVYFAGEAVSEDVTSTVHGAGLSGISVAEGILEGG